MAATPPWWRAANSNLSRAAIEAAYNEYFDSSSDESPPPSPQAVRQAKVPRLQAPARGIPPRAPSLWAPSFANVELARAATLGGYAIALERRAANERYSQQRRGLLRPAAVSRPSSTTASRGAGRVLPSSRPPSLEPAAVSSLRRPAVPLSAPPRRDDSARLLAFLAGREARAASPASADGSPSPPQARIGSHPSVLPPLPPSAAASEPLASPVRPPVPPPAAAADRAQPAPQTAAAVPSGPAAAPAPSATPFAFRADSVLPRLTDEPPGRVPGTNSATLALSVPPLFWGWPFFCGGYLGCSSDESFRPH